MKNQKKDEMKSYFERLLEEAQKSGEIGEITYEELSEETIRQMNEAIDEGMRDADARQRKTMLSAHKLFFG